ncbi:MAG: SPFH domain-containing protein [bacterium]|nr:SPFH domain-containing protein [bacterium]
MDIGAIPLEAWILILSLIAGAFKSLGFVREGERGIRLRFGVAEKNNRDPSKGFVIRGPGMVFLIPFVDSLEKRHVRQQTVNLINQEILIGGAFPFTVSAVIVYKVSDVYKALFEISGLEESLANVATVMLQEELIKSDFENLAKEDQTSGVLLERLQGVASDWGVEIIDFGLTDFKPAPEIVSIISLSEGINLKIAAIKKGAELLGIPVEQMPSSLAAALIGIPVVSTLNDNKTIKWEAASSLLEGGSGAEGKDWLASIAELAKPLSRLFKG